RRDVARRRAAPGRLARGRLVRRRRALRLLPARRVGCPAPHRSERAAAASHRAEPGARAGAQLAGGPLGGVLFGAARLLPFAVDAASYAVSFVSLLFVRPALQESRERPPTRLRSEVAEGMHWLWNQPFLRTATLLVAGTNFVHQGLF